MEPQQSGVKTWQWVVTAIVIIILIVIGIMVFGGKSSSTPSDTNDDTDTTTPLTPGANSIIMSDQYPGNVVYVSSVQATAPGWLVIHKSVNGQPGAIIGSVYVNAGIAPARVNLTEPIIDGMSYFAMLHSDDGDKQFDVTKDLPVKDASGNTIMRLFRSTSAANVDIKG